VRTLFNLLNSWNTFKKAPNFGTTIALIPRILPGPLEQGQATIINTLQGALGFTRPLPIRPGPNTRAKSQREWAFSNSSGASSWETISWGHK
jgi:hypothetical protein